MIRFLKISVQKEKIYWKRIKNMFKSISSWPGKIISGPILLITITFFHYCFFLMHFMFEGFLYITNRKQYRKNMENLEKRF